MTDKRQLPWTTPALTRISVSLDTANAKIGSNNDGAGSQATPLG
jgi:hypothetical protein